MTSQIGKPRQTNTPRFNPDEDGKRRVTLMRRVHLIRKRGERIQVLFDAKGQPIGKEGNEQQSWIGVLAREQIPIWIADFRSADLVPRKERVWVEVITSFTVEISFKKLALKSCAQSAKKFRYDLYQTFVKDHIDEESGWERPPKVVNNHPSITQDDILTKSLGNDKHSGRTCSQSKLSGSRITSTLCKVQGKMLKYWQ